MELLSKFQTRTVLTIVRERGLHIYQNEVIKLACSVSILGSCPTSCTNFTAQHPFLMHAVLALTLMHDRHLSATPKEKLSNTEAFHWYQSIALFSSKLASPIESSERDPLWATAVFLGIMAVYYIEANTAEQAWPFKPSSSMDLNWLKMSQGKKEIWKITQPLRNESVFRPLVMDNMSFIPDPSTLLGLEVLPPDLTKLCDLDASSTIDKSPYYATASALAQVLNVDDKFLTIMNFLQFINFMRPDYRRLLELKDPRALLLLAYWYAKVCQTQQWWLWHRAALEGQAICIYLGRNYQHEADIQNLLQFPSISCNNFAR